MGTRIGKVIGGFLAAWAVLGIILTLLSTLKKDWASWIPVAAKSPAARLPFAGEELPDSLKIWNTLALMTPQMSTPPPRVARLVGTALDVVGFLILNEGDPDQIREFLLTPVPGGCIHVPPPPPNYILHVLMEPGHTTSYQGGAVVVHGILEVPDNPLDRQYYSYQMTAQSVVQYKKPD